MCDFARDGPRPESRSLNLVPSQNICCTRGVPLLFGAPVGSGTGLCPRWFMKATRSPGFPDTTHAHRSGKAAGLFRFTTSNATSGRCEDCCG